MAQDYHIYIHSDKNGSGNNTKPFSNDKDSAFKTIASQDSILEDDTEVGAAALSKVAPAVAVAVAVAKVTDKILSVGFSHLREYTGHYEYELGYNNFKTAINHIVNPVGYIKQTLHRDFQFRKENQRIEQEAKVIGKTIYSDVKIGV